MPKGSRSTGKQAKSSVEKSKEAKKSTSKSKEETSYSKLVKAAVEIANRGDNGKKSVSKEKKGEKVLGKSPAKRMPLRNPKKSSVSKSKSGKKKSPLVSNRPDTSRQKESSTNPTSSDPLKSSKEYEEIRTKRKGKGGIVTSEKSKSKGKTKERSRTKSAKKDPGLVSPVQQVGKITPNSTSSKKSGSKSVSKSSDTGSAPRYVEISGGGKLEKSQVKTKPLKSKGKTSTEQVKASSSHGKVSNVSVKNVKESSSNIESSSSVDLSGEQKRKGKTDKINKEVEEAIKNIESKKKYRKSDKLLEKKRKRDTSIVPHTAKDYGYVLQRNPNSKIKPFINLEDLSKHPVINYSDVLLSLLELGHNSNSYLFAYSSKSKSFWSDILEYKILKKIFSEFKAETLRKYWVELSKHDSEEASDLIKKNKAFLDKTPLKLGTIVSSVSKLLNGDIKNLQEYISNIQVDIRKREIFEHEYKNPVTGELTKVKEVRTTYNTRKRYEPGSTKNFNGAGINIVSLKEVYHQNGSLNDFQKVMKTIRKEDSVKESYLNEVTEEEKKKLNTINEDDKFIFKTIDNVLDVLCSEFKNYGQDYILETLQQNSLDIGKTYACLKDPIKNRSVGFTPLDDKVLLRKQGEEYKYLLKEKGKEALQDREAYLTQ